MIHHIKYKNVEGGKVKRLTFGIHGKQIEKWWRYLQLVPGTDVQDVKQLGMEEINKRT